MTSLEYPVRNPSIINVAIFPCTSENAKSVGKCLSQQVNFCTFGLGSTWHPNASPGIQRYFDHVYRNIPGINENLEPAEIEHFLLKLNEFIAQKNIHCLIPTHDTTAWLLSRLASKIRCKLITSPEITAHACRFKSRTYELFYDQDWCPVVYKNYNEAKRAVMNGASVFSKPNGGQGGRKSYAIHQIGDFQIADMLDSRSGVQSVDDRLLVEYIGNASSNDITVDCFSTTKGELKTALPRVRKEVVDGIANACYYYHESNAFFNMVANKIQEVMRPVGMWFFQMRSVIKGNRETPFKLLEVSCRPSTGIDYANQIGFNLPALACYDALDFPLEIPRISDQLNNPSMMRVSEIRQIDGHITNTLSYEHVWVDLFDTLIVRSKLGFAKVNPKILAFLHDQRNQSKKIHLVTRMAPGTDGPELIDLLVKYRISQYLFDSMAIIDDPKQPKSDAIKGWIQANHNQYKEAEYRSIFVDNSFKERQEVSQSLNIPVFDVNAIDCLMSKDM